MSKVGSKTHKSTTMKPKAGLIQFKGHFVVGLVYSIDGKTPAVYKSQNVAERMAAKRGLKAVWGKRSTCWYLVKE